MKEITSIHVLFFSNFNSSVAAFQKNLTVVSYGEKGVAAHERPIVHAILLAFPFDLISVLYQVLHANRTSFVIMFLANLGTRFKEFNLNRRCDQQPVLPSMLNSTRQRLHL